MVPATPAVISRANEPRRDPLCLRNSIAAAALVLFFFVGLLMSTPAWAQCAGICKSNEVLVDEDDKNCYCKDRKEYAECIRDAGKKLGAKVTSCEGMLACLGRNEITDEVGLCAATLLTVPLAAAAAPAGVPLAVSGAAITCTWLSNDGIKKARACLQTHSYTCAADALETHKADVKDCRE